MQKKYGGLNLTISNNSLIKSCDEKVSLSYNIVVMTFEGHMYNS